MNKPHMTNIELDLTEEEIADLLRFGLLTLCEKGIYEFTEKGLEALRKQLEIQ